MRCRYCITFMAFIPYGVARNTSNSVSGKPVAALRLIDLAMSPLCYVRWSADLPSEAHEINYNTYT